MKFFNNMEFEEIIKRTIKKSGKITLTKYRGRTVYILIPKKEKLNDTSG